MSDPTVMLIVVVVLALAFDFSNGWHDSANAIATVVSTHVLNPAQAVLLAAALNIAGAFMSTAVAKMIGGGIVEASLINQETVAAALVGAIVWNTLTLLVGLPMISSHAFTGGLVGGTLVPAGQIQQMIVPSWVILSCALAMGLGTAAGGWRIIRTLGMRIIKMEPVHGFAAETSAAIILLGTAHFGMPVSTTHTITSSIMGVGAVTRLSAVRWGVTLRIVYAWVLTLPGAGLVAYLFNLVLQSFR